MKTQKGIREHDADELRKAKRLEPIRKSGKERHALYSSFCLLYTSPSPRD